MSPTEKVEENELEIAPLVGNDVQTQVSVFPIELSIIDKIQL